MGRLIDADKLIDYFYYGEDDKPIIDEIADRKIIKIINAQPTAYKVDKVVEELEGSLAEGMSGVSFTKNAMEIIDIVKGGGVDE